MFIPLQGPPGSRAGSPWCGGGGTCGTCGTCELDCAGACDGGVRVGRGAPFVCFSRMLLRNRWLISLSVFLGSWSMGGELLVTSCWLRVGEQRVRTPALATSN